MVRKDRQIIDKLKKLNVWRRAGTRAVHKLLLLLLALGRFSREEPDEVKFEEVCEELASLLKEFGSNVVRYCNAGGYPECVAWEYCEENLRKSDSLKREEEIGMELRKEGYAAYWA